MGIARDVTSRINQEKKHHVHEKRLEVLYQYSSLLEEADTKDEIYNIAYKGLAEALEGSLYDILVVDGNTLHDIYSTDSFFSTTLDGPGITARTARTGQSQLVGDVRNDPDYVTWTDQVILSELAVPVIQEGQVISVINVESTELDAFTLQDQQMLETFAHIISHSIVRIERMDILENLVFERTSELVESNKQLKELDDVKNRFISTATHEIRTPLTAIIGFLELLTFETERIPDEVMEDLMVVYRNATRLEKLTKDLLDAQRITTGKMEVESVPFDIVSLLNEVVEELRPFMADNNQVIEIFSPDSLMVNADRMRISQVFMNLLSNAVKFSQVGGKIIVSTGLGDGFAEVMVKDNGIGLSEEDMGKLFEPFPLIRHDLVVPSTGLGLSICKGILELHDGKIWAESAGKGKGSTFTFTIPTQ